MASKSRSMRRKKEGKMDISNKPVPLKLDGKEMKPGELPPGMVKMPKPPPDEGLTRVQAGPAQRNTTIIREREHEIDTTTGVFWMCPQCKQYRYIWSQKAHNELAVGNNLKVMCSCGLWLILEKKSIVGATEKEAKRIIASARG